MFALRKLCPRRLPYLSSRVTKQPLSAIEGLLPGDAFIRVHRSFIVAMDKIRSYTHEIIEVDGQELPIGRNYRTEVEKVLRG